jgi:hypothetical protein
MAYPLDQIREALAEHQKSAAFRDALRQAGYEIVPPHYAAGRTFNVPLRGGGRS